MPFINFHAREINCKLVYYGPGLGGKTANLQWIYDHTGQNQKGKMVSLATETDRTLFFDFLPLDLGTVRGFKTRFHLYTVPGQVFYEASRRGSLKGTPDFRRWLFFGPSADIDSKGSSWHGDDIHVGGGLATVSAVRGASRLTKHPQCCA